MRARRIMPMLVVGAVLGAFAVTAAVAVRRFQGDVVAAQGSSGTSPLKVDEYYPVKIDWISSDRSIRTIKHRPTGSCYILVYPTGDSLVPVEKERCATTSAAIEK